MDGTCLLRINLSSCYRLPLWKYCSNLSFLNYCMFPGSYLRLHPRRRPPTLWSLWIYLPPSWIRDVGVPWARVWPILNQMIEAVIWTLKDSFPTKCTDCVAETWRGALSLRYCYCDERTEESKHWHVRLKSERPCRLGISRKENWDFTRDDVKRTPSQSGQNKHDNYHSGGVWRYMSCKKPEVAQGLGRMKTERDRRIVASIEARRRKMLRAMTKVRVKMG